MFFDWWGHSNLTTCDCLPKGFTLYSIYRSNRPLWKLHGIASINFYCFTTDQSNQVKTSREIMRSQGYFFKIALGTRLLQRYLAKNFPII